MTESTRIALVTGASRGLGLVIARVLAKRGYGLVIGGPNPGDGNLISGNTETGMHLLFGDNATIQGNLLGTDAK